MYLFPSLIPVVCYSSLHPLIISLRSHRKLVEKQGERNYGAKRVRLSICIKLPAQLDIGALLAAPRFSLNIWLDYIIDFFKGHNRLGTDFESVDLI